MSEHAEKLRKERSEKIKRYLRKDPQGKIDASEYTPPNELMADVKTGMRPISKRQFKKGGEVVGDKGKHHAGRKKRAEGGPLDMDNRDLKAENKKRDGEKHVGGFKDGGRPKRAAGGPMMAGAAPMGPQAPINVPTQAIGGFAPSSKGLMTQAGMAALKRGGKAPGNDRITGTRPTGGRLAKADGGATKSKKGAVNIIIAVGGGQKGGMPPGGPGMPPGPPLAHPPVPPQAIGGAGAGLVPPQAGGVPPMGPGAGGAPMLPPGGAMPIGRKAGGSVTHAAGGGEGRLEKVRKYGRGI